MQFNLKDFDVRRSAPKISGSYSFPANIERYVVRSQSLIGLDIFSGDKIKIIDREGGQICETIAFERLGNNNQSIIH